MPATTPRPPSSEQVAAFDRNAWSRSIGIPGRNPRNPHEGDSGLEAAFAQLLMLARRVREQKQRQRGSKVYSLHAPEVECIGKGKAHRPYEFGVKVSVATTISHARGGQFVTHVQALPGNPMTVTPSQP
jgi:hypothetical protein